MAKKYKESKWTTNHLLFRWKIPFLDLFIVEGHSLRKRDKERKELDDKIEILESEFKQQLRSNAIAAKMIGNMQCRINVMTGRLRAPECPKCGKPKIPGGIQWLDHAKCKRKAQDDKH